MEKFQFEAVTADLLGIKPEVAVPQERAAPLRQYLSPGAEAGARHGQHDQGVPARKSPHQALLPLTFCTNPPLFSSWGLSGAAACGRGNVPALRKQPRAK